MCGIIGYVGEKNHALKVLINGLKTLEYRGYDSAGIAYLNVNKINIIKEKGKIVNLEKKINDQMKSNIGIGHTRWATHGKPSVINSHPHSVGKITIVHNGIIENYEIIKKELIKEGYIFKSETDTEVACALIDKLYKKHNNMLKALNSLKNIIKGSYAFGILVEDEKNTMYALRKDNPLIIGLGNQENYIASDIPAILKYTKKYILLDDHEIVKLTSKQVDVYSDESTIIQKKIQEYEYDLEISMKNGYDHFMLKEMNEQPKVIKETLNSILGTDFKYLNNILSNLRKYNKIEIVACGSAYYAGYVGKHLIEKYGEIPVSVDIASEYRYKKIFPDKNKLVIIISQSGETADSLAALRLAKENKMKTLAIVNVLGSSIARESDWVIYTKAGCEIAVATTKAYSSQVVVLTLIALYLGITKDLLSEKVLTDLRKNILEIEENINSLLKLNQNYLKIAKYLTKYKEVFYLGRGIDYALSLEGALKLKEISYIHSEAYPAGELKHGSISLIEKGTPVIAIITDMEIAEKTISNLKEVKARGAYIVLITTSDIKTSTEFSDIEIRVPFINEYFKALSVIIPLQIIAYEVAKIKKCDIDQPRNLAKSVTVE